MNPINNISFVFPGQGSQKVGMLDEFAGEHIVRVTFSEASDILGYDVWRLIQEGDPSALNLTVRTQPILLCCSVALWRLWLARGGITPDYLAGHSLGEWSALVCAGAISFEEALSIVEERGALMQSAVPEGSGAMAAVIGLNDRAVLECCEQARANGEVSAVNFNAPGQIVIAGTDAAVKTAISLCKKAGAKRSILLPVSAPFHTPMMRSAAEKLGERLKSVLFSYAEIPVIHNVHGCFEDSPEGIKAAVLKQIYQPVLWVKCVERLCSEGANIFIECGPGSILSGLIRRIDKNIRVYPLHTIDAFESAISAASE